MELPLPSDHEGIRAFHIAAELTRVACEYAGGHGIHHAGVPKNGTAEIRLQFPEAPYNLTLYVEDEMLVKASFEPTPVINGALQRVYHFSGRLNVKQCGEGQIESFNADFARWGKEHSQKKPNIEPLEETVAFSVLKKVLSDS